MLKGALGLGIGFTVPGLASALVADDERQARPRKGDRLVFAYGDRAGQVIVPADLARGGPQQLAFPMDPVTKVVRDGSLLNQVAWVRLDPSLLSEETRAQAAEGIVAYSAICTHQGCPISMWHQPRVRRGPVPRPRASDPLPDPVAQAAAERRRPAGRVEGHDGNADPRPLRLSANRSGLSLEMSSEDQ